MSEKEAKVIRVYDGLIYMSDAMALVGGNRKMIQDIILRDALTIVPSTQYHQRKGIHRLIPLSALEDRVTALQLDRFIFEDADPSNKSKGKLIPREEIFTYSHHTKMHR